MTAIMKPITNINIVRLGLLVLSAIYLSMTAYVSWKVIIGQ